MERGSTDSPAPRRRSGGPRSRSDLEPVLLGIVSKFGPCTGYAVRGHLADSPTRLFSASTGSVYPALRRLEQEGLVRRRPGARGQQRRSLFEITPAGEDAVRTWLRTPLDEDILSVPYDPLRTRSWFLATLGAEEERIFLDEALARLEERLPRVSAWARSQPTELGRLAAEGCVDAARAQLRWLRRLRRARMRADGATPDRA